MGLNAATFLKRLEGVITGSGFRRVIPGIGIESLRTSAGLILTAGTVPTRASLETNFEGIQHANGETDLGSLQFVVPRDYDESCDELKIRFLAQSGGTTNTPTIDAALYRKRKESAISSDLNPTISGAINASSSYADWVEIDCSNLSLKAGDAIHVDFTSSAHGTDAIDIYGLEVWYRSDLVFFELSDR